MRILMIEDDKKLCASVKFQLEKQGYSVDVCHDGEEGLFLMKERAHDCVLLDRMLPGMDGMSVLKNARISGVRTPVILLTALGGLSDRVEGLDMGADDYIVKPFSPSEVMARLRAVLRRINRDEISKDSASVLKVNNMEVNLEEYSFMIDGRKIPLTKKEIETMWTLAGNPNKVFTRDNLLDSLWGYDYYGDSRTVDSHIKRLRAKIDSVEHPAWSIKTIWGVGYKFAINEEDI